MGAGLLGSLWLISFCSPTLDSLGIAMEMMQDWDSALGAKEVLPWVDQYVPSYGLLARAHASATKNATAEDEGKQSQ
jgi:hypothetical protein